ncbi:hypothetical protein LCGC14_0308730 [marine sediment metagenome]|uniref:Response regulatory domain-containing protein n=2 Tax=root TaxID=1 RepID=A0A0F9W9S7_9ZZZZ
MSEVASLKVDDIDSASMLTRHIPIHIISVQEQRRRGVKMGAYGFTGKPAERDELLAAFVRLKDFVERPERGLLVVKGAGGDAALEGLLGKQPGVVVKTVRPGSALKEAESGNYDCVVIDCSSVPAQGTKFLGDLSGAALADGLPVIVYAPKDLSAKNMEIVQTRMPRINKRLVTSSDALVYEAALFLHQRVSDLPDQTQEAVGRVEREDTGLAGTRVAIIDDDIRNIFSLTSVLEQYGVEVFHAEDGRGGIDLVRKIRGLNVVLVDIMMPEMDG